jgi:hypothetical protein
MASVSLQVVAERIVDAPLNLFVVQLGMLFASAFRSVPSGVKTIIAASCH